MRLYSIMNDLLNEKDYLSLDFFMERYQVSKRTIQNDLSYLIQVSSRKGFQLHMRRGRGYLLEVINKDLLDEFIETLKVNEVYSTKDRIRNIVAYLVIQKNFISMDRIAEHFQISKTSVKNNMHEVDELVKSYQLELERRSHYGVRIVGSMKAYKTLLADLFYDENKIIEKEFDEVLKDFTSIDNALIAQMEEEDLNINYNELKNVVVWLRVTAYYAYLKKEVSDIDSIDESSWSHRIAWKMKEQLEKHYPIEISKESIDLLIDKLQKNVRIKVAKTSLSKELSHEIDKFLIEIDESYHTEFSNDAEFKKSLLTHVSLLIDRLHQKISYKNTLINEICIRYPMIFNIAIRFSDMLKEKYGVEVTHDEAGFIATHFAGHMEKERNEKIMRFNNIGVVCSSGGGSAYLIKMQLESLFTSSNVQTFSFLQLDELEQFKPDLIFTIMELDREFQVPVIHIKELLDDDDLMQIRKFLQYDNCHSFSLVDNGSPITKLFCHEFFKIASYKTYEDALKDMAKQLEDSGYGGENYQKYVLERESYMSTVYMNGVCIPHPIEISAQKNMISVCILDNPLVHEGKPVRIIFMVSLVKEDYEVHKEVTRLLYLLMKDERRLKRVLEMKTLEELLIVIKELNGGV